MPTGLKLHSLQPSTQTAGKRDFGAQMYRPPIPVAARSKAWVCGRSLAGIDGSNPSEGMKVFLW